LKVLSYIQEMGRCGALFLLCISLGFAEPDKAKLRGLLESGTFAELDAQMASYQAAYREGTIGDEEASKPFIALKTNDPDLRPAYDKWVAQHPDSYAARLARGFYLTSLGYVARGSSYASETPRARFGDMRALFNEARSDLQSSLKLDPKPTLSFGSLISIARADHGFGDPADYLAQAVALDDNVYTARIAYLSAIRPEWGGSHAEMESFIAQSEPSLLPHQIAKLKFVLQESKARSELEPAQHLVKEKQYAQAVRLYDAALFRSPSAHGFVSRGRAYARMNQHKKAIEDFDRALELDPQDNCCAHTNRAYSYIVTGAIGKAVPDLEYAAEERDDHWAAQQLAVMYGFGRWGMKRDPAVAKRWCERAAKQGDPWAMYCMGGLYDSGIAVQHNSMLAAQWFERAAERGVADAQADIAYMYWTGEGVSWNPVSALQWWMRAATQGNERARQKLISVAVGPALIILLLGVLGAIRHRRKTKSI
jgi:tetratricopeptide (TPR) repeat protein